MDTTLENKISFTNKVVKVGGSTIAQSLEQVINLFKNNTPRYLVVSAPGRRNENDEKVTDLLINAYENTSGKQIKLNVEKIINRYSELLNFVTKERKEFYKQKITAELIHRIETKEKESIVAFGEWASAFLFGKILKKPLCNIENYLTIKENKEYDFIDDDFLESCVVPGFYGRSEKGKIKLFSRDGTDFSAAIIASQFKIDMYKISDQNLKVTLPEYITNPKHIEEITYLELRALCALGRFNIVHQDVWRLLEKRGITLYVSDITLNNPTKVFSERKFKKNEPNIVGFSYIDNNVFLLNIDSKTPSNEGFESKVTKKISDLKINIITSSGGVTGTTYYLDDSTLTSEKIQEIEKFCNKNDFIYDAKQELSGVVLVGKRLEEKKADIYLQTINAIKNSGNKLYATSSNHTNLIAIINGDNAGKKTVEEIYKSFYDKNYRS